MVRPAANKMQLGRHAVPTLPDGKVYPYPNPYPCPYRYRFAIRPNFSPAALRVSSFLAKWKRT
jgi:hypothetical protein